jgi:hypothetical protein
MITGQEFSRLIFVVISFSPGEDTAKRLINSGDNYPECRMKEYINKYEEE